MLCAGHMQAHMEVAVRCTAAPMERDIAAFMCPLSVIEDLPRVVMVGARGGEPLHCGSCVKQLPTSFLRASSDRCFSHYLRPPGL